jgi:prephenate dehydrogenase
VSFVGGHPIAGTERSGVESAVSGLFEGRTCVLTPEPDTNAAALEAVTDLWKGVGAQVTFLAPEVHDRIFALVSHLPHALAYGLLHTVTETLEPGQADLAGGSLRDFTRVTAGSPAVWREIFLENREALLFALDAFSARLSALRGAVEGGDADALGRFFRRATEIGASAWKR